jgi:protein tyrosine/serine phosphatase
MAKIFGGALQRWERSLDSRADRARAWADMLFYDHGIARLIWRNRGRVSADILRSAQPAPWDLRAWHTQGVRTIINLRGARNCGSYLLAKERCEELGICLIDAPFGSREAPSYERVARFVEAVRSAEGGILLHCKSGADRAGLAAALALMTRHGVDAETAKDQLTVRHGHIRQSKTGVLDRVFEAFIEETGGGDIDGLLSWMASDAYDPARLKAEHQESLWAKLLVDKVLRRE